MDLTEKTKNINRHPWELSRCYNILKFLSNNNKNFVYADIGAGGKFFTEELLKLTNGTVFAVDIKYKKARVEEKGIICLNDTALLEDNSVDCVIMMDVLEHVEDESTFLKTILEKLKPEGKIIITVPAMQFLFSSHDIFVKHHRRYSRKQLLEVLSNHNIAIEQNFYFFSSLFLLRSISLLVEKLRLKKIEYVGSGMWNHESKSTSTNFIYYFLNIDFLLNKLLSKLSIHLPGLSILAICHKNK